MLQRLDTGEISNIGTEADGGLPLGITPEMGYESASAELPPNSRMLIYTDGLTDAMPLDAAGCASFGVPGIVRVLKECRELPLEETMDRLFRASKDYTGGAGRHDDTSVVLLERSPV